jgi:transcriptional regulator with XRE-family HTH domain
MVCSTTGIAVDGERALGDRRREFRDWFAHELRRREWTQADFARRSGVATSVVSRWMNLQATPEPSSCDIIADVFGIDYDFVLAKAGHRSSLDGEASEALDELMAKLRRMKLNATRERIIRNILDAYIEEDRSGFVLDQAPRQAAVSRH